MQYRREIDGLRAIAVIPVMLFHAGFELFSGGYIGVDVFFVISGYLITGTIIYEMDNDKFSIAHFYERRARRILPALFLVVAACLPFAWMWLLPTAMKDFSESLIAVSVFMSNILFWFESGYFDRVGEMKPLLHTWSLSVEEQYYLIFPVVLIVLWRFGRARVFWTIASVAILSLVLSEWGSVNRSSANFYLLPTRAWEILSGSVAAFVVDRRGVVKSNFLSFVGIAFIVTVMFVYDESTPMPGMLALVPVVGVVLLLLYCPRETIVAKLLSTKIIVGLGLVSYSAYLWHQPILAFARVKLQRDLSDLMMLTLVFASLVISYFSWRFVEVPFRQAGRYPRSAIFTLSLVGIGVLSGIGLVGVYSEGFPNRYEVSVDGDVGHLEYHQHLDEKYFDCEPQSIFVAALSFQGFSRCKQSKLGQFDWLLLGDSHAEHLFLGLAKDNPRVNIAFYIFGASPYLGNESFRDIFELLSELDGAKVIFLTMHYLTRVSSRADLLDGFQATVEHLQRLGHKVILVGDVPKFEIDPEYCKYAASTKVGSSHCSIPLSSFQRQLNVSEPVLEQISVERAVPFFRIHAPLCDASRCYMVKNGTLLYRDNNHLNIPGSVLVGEYLSDQVRAYLINTK